MSILLVKDYQSEILQKNVTIHILLPNQIKENTKSLYFLHGVMENANIVLQNSNLIDLVEKYNIVVILPTLGNGFYVNKHHYFINNELVSYIRKQYNLSNKKEDTFIAGISMGGFGALYNGLKRNDLFSKIISISGALDIGFGSIFIKNCGSLLEPWLLENKSDLNSKYDLKQLISNDLNQSYYLSCGNKDFLLKINQKFVNYLLEKKIKFDYFERNGNHDWSYWESELNHVFQWIIEEGD